jgi:hypothetical protein
VTPARRAEIEEQIAYSERPIDLFRELLAEIDRLTTGIHAFIDAPVYGPHTDYERHRALHALVGIVLTWREDDDGWCD